MAALDIAPLGLVAAGDAEWQCREGDLQRLVDEATAQFRTASGRLLPLGLEPEFNFYRRYIPGGLPECECAVGVVGEFANHGTPFWLRYDRYYCKASFETICDRIMTSRFAPDARGDGGHIWVPLRVSADRSGAAIVPELVGEIEEIRAVAAGVRFPELGPS